MKLRGDAQSLTAQVTAWAVLILFPDGQPSQTHMSALNSLAPNCSAHFLAVASSPALLFRPISKPAACLLVPYILWVSFATVLNTSLYVLNR